LISPVFRDETRSADEAIRVLIKPIQQRFHFHFQESRSTNNLNHPEWYIGYLRTIILKQQSSVVQIFNNKKNQISKFLNQFYKLITVKFQHDLSDLIENSVLLCETIQEIVKFGSELHYLFDLPFLGLDLKEKEIQLIPFSLLKYMESKLVVLMEASDSSNLVVAEDQDDEDDENEAKKTVFQNSLEKYLVLFSGTSHGMGS
jgi:hypothetical protein